MRLKLGAIRFKKLPKAIRQSHSLLIVCRDFAYRKMDQTIYISGPEPKLELSYNDVWLPGLYSRRILCFELPPTSSHERVLHVLKRALQSLIDGTPELGSIVELVPAERDGQLPWKALRPGNGIELIVKDLLASFPSFEELEAKNFLLPEFKDKVLMPVAVEIQAEPNPQTRVQLNLIEGGVLLSFCECHALADGNGMNTIMAALGKECKRAAKLPGKLPPHLLNIDRSVFNDLGEVETDLKDHSAYGFLEGAWLPHPAPVEAPKEDSEQAAPAEPPIPSEPAPEVTVHSYRITSPSAAALKAAATTDSHRISTHDAIAALIWRTTILARRKAGKFSSPDQISTITLPVNARKHLAIPKAWIGNCVYFLAASFPVSEIIKPTSLPLMASAIRTALNAITPNKVAGLMSLRRRHPYDITWWPFFEINKPWIVGMTSLYHSELYGTDWGEAFGIVRHFTTSDEGAVGGFRRCGAVGAKFGDGNGGCDVAVGFDGEEIGFVRRDGVWNEYFSELGA